MSDVQWAVFTLVSARVLGDERASISDKTNIHPGYAGCFIIQGLRIPKPPTPGQPGHSFNMLTEAYMEAQLVDEELADLMWECWDAGGLMI